MNLRALSIVLLSVWAVTAFGQQLPGGIELDLKQWNPDESYKNVRYISTYGDYEYYMFEPDEKKAQKMLQKRDHDLKLVTSGEFFPESLMDKLKIDDYRNLEMIGASVHDDGGELTLFFKHRGAWASDPERYSLINVTYETETMSIVDAFELKETVLNREKGHYYSYETNYDKEGAYVSIAYIDSDREGSKTNFKYYSYDLKGGFLRGFDGSVSQAGDVVVDVSQMLESGSGAVYLRGTFTDKSSGGSYPIIYSFEPAGGDIGYQLLTTSGEKRMEMGKLVYVESDRPLLVGMYAEKDDKLPETRGYYIMNIDVNSDDKGTVTFWAYDNPVFDIQNKRTKKNKASGGVADYLELKDVLVENGKLYFISTAQLMNTYRSQGSSMSSTTLESAELIVSVVDIDDQVTGMKSAGMLRLTEGPLPSGMKVEYERMSTIEPWVKDGVVYMFRYELEKNLNADKVAKLSFIKDKAAGIVLSVFPLDQNKAAYSVMIPELFGKALAFEDMWGYFPWLDEHTYLLEVEDGRYYRTAPKNVHILRVLQK